MTQEEKQLLLKDLCARLPYGVICEILFVKEELKADYIKYIQKDTTFQIKPYLRPMSSMTEEEWDEYKSTWKLIEHDLEDTYEPSIESYDWLNAHHFDCRGLIEKGLAIEVTEENNPYKD